MNEYSGCYLLHLYCDRCGEINDNTRGETLNQCIVDARNMGWKIIKNKKIIVKIICPKCKELINGEIK
mgnify:CR=1 FL=1